jgi:hypothetical protein
MMRVTYSERPDADRNPEGGGVRMHVFLDGRFAGKIELIYPRRHDPRWRYLGGGFKTHASEMFETLAACKA